MNQRNFAASFPLIRSIAQTEVMELNCEEVAALLDEFAEAVLLGHAVGPLVPLVERHLARCPDCQEEYEALLRMLKATLEVE